MSNIPFYVHELMHDCITFDYFQYYERFVTDVRMRAHNAAEAVLHHLPEMPQLPEMPKLPNMPQLPEMPQLPGLPRLPNLPQFPELNNIQENVLLQMKHVRSTAAANAQDLYLMLQVSQCISIPFSYRYVPYRCYCMTCSGQILQYKCGQRACKISGLENDYFKTISCCVAKVLPSTTFRDVLQLFSALNCNFSIDKNSAS